MTLLRMEGVVIVMTVQTCQRDYATNAKPGSESMQVVYADLAENPAQVHRRRFIAQSVVFGHLLERGSRCQKCINGSSSGNKKKKLAKKSNHSRGE